MSLPHPRGEVKGGRSHPELCGPALLSALRQETACEKAARHHTEALLKIHVYRSSSFINAPSSLYVYEVRCFPVALASDPPRVRCGVQETARSLLNYPTFKGNQITDKLPRV